MIYSPSRFVFIHLPRTGGFSITQALASRIMALGDLTVVTSGLNNSGPQGWWTHSRACELRNHIPHWDSLWKFAVIRNPWDMVASRWRWTQRMWSLIESRPIPTAPPNMLHWRELYSASKMTFEEWIPWAHIHLRGHDGFWQFYCCRSDGSSLGVEPIAFEKLQDEWPSIAERLALPNLQLPRLNTSNEDPPAWTQAAIDTVAEMCVNDVERFAFKPPRI